MARRISTSQQAAAPDSAADDLATLFPDRTLQIADREVTVREFTLLDSLHLNREIATVVEGLSAMPEGADAAPSFASLVAALAGQPDVAVRLIAASCQQPVDWVAGLRGSDGELLLQMFWVVNAPFFINRLLTDAEYRRAAAGGQSDSANSSPPSSPTATTATP